MKGISLYDKSRIETAELICDCVGNVTEGENGREEGGREENQGGGRREGGGNGNSSSSSLVEVLAPISIAPQRRNLCQELCTDICIDGW